MKTDRKNTTNYLVCDKFGIFFVQYFQQRIHGFTMKTTNDMKEGYLFPSFMSAHNFIQEHNLDMVIMECTIETLYYGFITKG